MNAADTLTIADLSIILARQIAETKADIANKTKAIIASAKFHDMSSSAVVQGSMDLVALRSRLMTLEETARIIVAARHGN